MTAGNVQQYPDQAPGDLTEVRPRLLLVEDDRELVGLLARVLADAGYLVQSAGDGQTGLHLGLTQQFDVMIIDRGLPAVDGVDLTARLRRQGVRTPVLILSAYGTVTDRVTGLDAGAEDYLVKPFDITELLARLRALRRRNDDSPQETVSLDGGLLNRVTRVVEAGGRSVQLSAREAQLLTVLASRPRRVFGRDELRERIFDAAESVSIVDTYVYYLRRKLGRSVVRTVRGLGYRAGSL